MPARAREAEPVPSHPTPALDDLLSELGEVEWLGHQLRDRTVAATRRHEPSLWVRLLTTTH